MSSRFVFGLLLALLFGASTSRILAWEATSSIELLKSTWRGVEEPQIRAAAEKGDASAQYVLALSLIYRPDEPSKQEGFRWATNAASCGLAAAEGLVGWAYQYGLGVGKDKSLALAWTHRSAERGFTESEYQLGFFLTRQFDSNGTQQADFKQVAEWYQRAARKGHTKAEHALGDLYFYGKLGDGQRTNCIVWYQRAAAKGNAESKARLSEALSRYSSLSSDSAGEIIRRLRESAAGGNLEAQLKLALRYQSGDGVERSESEAYHWMKHAAEHDAAKSSVAAEANYRLGLMYENGQGVPKDMATARRLFLVAAVQNHTGSPDAAYRVAQMYETGLDVPQNDTQATIWYYFAATQLGGGLLRQEAITSLFRLYAAGRGALSPEEIARVKSESGMDHSFTNHLTTLRHQITTADGQFYVGEIYHQGKLIPADDVEALAWYLQAAAQAHAEAKSGIERLQQTLTEDQFRQGEAEAANLLKIRQRTPR